MSEFDKSGFSAIDEFFGSDPKEAETKRIEVKGVNHGKGKRRGVGAVASSQQASTNEDLKKILKVGRKRRRGMDDDDDDEEDAAAEGPNDDDDEEEEAGRTAIASERCAKLTVDDNLLTSVAGSKSKKKRGKKERQKQKVEEIEKKTGDEVKEGENSISDGNMAEGGQVGGDASNGDKKLTQQKHKRRKVRSKQKNIRKDHREKKPEHLITGQKKYQGRPLTAETRVKLNLPPPKERKPFSAPPLQEIEPAVEAPGLAIDDFLEDKGESLVISQPEKVKERGQKKRQKSKYKNLRA